MSLSCINKEKLKVTTRQQIFEVLIAKIAEIIPELESTIINEDDSLKTLGVNSVDRVDILVETMEECGISLPLVNFANQKNIAGIITVMLNA